MKKDENQMKNKNTMNELFSTEETKPTKLQAARRALADAERELADAFDRNAPESEIDDYRRAANRFAELVKAEELTELSRSKR